MLLATWLGCNEAPDPEAERTRPKLVVIAEPRVEGELHPAVLGRMTRALETGSMRGDVEVVARDAICTQAGCPPIDFEVLPRFEVVDHDYRVRLRLRARRDGARARIVATSEEVCEVCSIDEAVDMVEAQAAALWTKLATTTLAPPELRIESRPPGATVTIDGALVGETPMRIPVEVGEHAIRIEAIDHAAQTLDIVAVEGFKETLHLQLLPMKRPDDLRRLKIGGWTTLALGIAVATAGSVLVALHGRPYPGRCTGADVDVDGDCRFDYDTRLGGAITLGTGALSIAIGTGLLTRWRLRRRDASSKDTRRLSGRTP